MVTKIGLLESNLSSFEIARIRFLTAGIVLLPVLPRAVRSIINDVAGYWELLAYFFISIGCGLPYIFLAGVGIEALPPVYFSIIIPSTALVISAVARASELERKSVFLVCTAVSFAILGVCMYGWV